LQVGDPVMLYHLQLVLNTQYHAHIRVQLLNRTYLAFNATVASTHVTDLVDFIDLFGNVEDVTLLIIK
jgi:hypothetical protein